MARRRRRTAYLACAGVESLACRQETSLGSAPAAPVARLAMMTRLAMVTVLASAIRGIWAAGAPRAPTVGAGALKQPVAGKTGRGLPQLHGAVAAATLLPPPTPGCPRENEYVIPSTHLTVGPL